MFHRKYRAFVFSFLLFTICASHLQSQVTYITPGTAPTTEPSADSSAPPTSSPSATPLPSIPTPLVMITPGLLLPNADTELAYQEPKMPVKLFDPEKIGLTPEQRAELATGVAQALKLITFQRQAFPNKLAMKALAFALCLDPENREAVIVNKQFREATLPQNVPAEPGTSAVGKKLAARSADLKSNPDANARLFRNLAMDLAVEFDTMNEDLLYEYEQNRKAGEKADWGSILGYPLMQESPDAKKVSVLTLMSLSGTTPGQISRYVRMDGVIQSGNGGSTSRLMVWGKLTPEMLSTYQKTEGIIKTLIPDYPKDADITIRYSGEFIKRNAENSDLPLALMLLSLTGQVSIDPDVAVAGILKEDGSIHAEDSITANTLQNITTVCKRAAIPEDASQVMEDMILLKRFEMLWEKPVFFIKNLDEAKKFAAPGIDPKMAKAIQVFAEAKELVSNSSARPSTSPTLTPEQRSNLERQRNQGPPNRPANFPIPLPSAGTMNPSTMTNSDAIRAKLVETLALAPNHASASILLRSMDGSLPQTLSLRGSLKELTIPFQLLFSKSKLINQGPGYARMISTTLETAPGRLEELAPILDPAAKMLKTDLILIILKWKQTLPAQVSEVGNQQLDLLREQIKTTVDKFKTEHQIPVPLEGL